MKFLVPNYNCLQNPWDADYRPQIPVLSVLCPQLNLLNHHRNKIPGYATDSVEKFSALVVDIAGGKEAEGVWEHGVQENICI